MSQLQIKTSYSEADQIILQRIIFEGTQEQDSGDKIDLTIEAKVIDLREKGLRDALIKLGWTPPKVKKRSCKECIHDSLKTFNQYKWTGKRHKVCVNWRGVTS